MKKTRNMLLTLLLALCALCLAFAFTGCGLFDSGSSSDGGDESSSSSGNVATPAESVYGVGEEGTYYYDGADGTMYMLSLQSGAFMVSVNSDTAYGGTYTVDEAMGLIYFTSSQRSFVAVMGTDSVQLVVDGASYTFLRQTKYDVVFLDADGNEIYRETVVYGRSADEPEMAVDGYIFIGWYADEDHRTEYSFNTAVTGTTYVYGWYVEELAGDFDFVVTLDYGDGTTETAETLNGAIFKGLPESHGGKDILGWWVSDTNKSSEPTRRYEYGDVFDSDTTLFAVYDEAGVLGASVTESGVTWEKYYSADVSVRICDEEGESVLSGSATGSSGRFYSANFAGLGTGTYTVEIVSGSVTETLTYVVNGLSRVAASSFEVTSFGNTRILRFAGVEGAEGYIVTVDDGGNTFTSDIGNDTYFSGVFEMTECGLTFSVAAYAEGCVSSVSDGRNYLLALGKTENISVDNDTVSWTRVDGAVSYEVTIVSGGDIVDVVTTADTQISLKNYENGTYDISVKAVAEGYFSEEKIYYGYGKQTLAAPVITDITSYEVTWTEVSGAVSYVVTIGNLSRTVTTTTLYLTEDLIPDEETFEISVKALDENGLDSPDGDPVTVTNGNFSAAISYERNTVTWNYDVAAAYYSVSVNGVTAEGDEQISFGASHEITLTKAGNNAITVTAYDKDGCSLGSSELDVYAYTVTLSSTVAVPDTPYIYVATGDVMHLGGATVEHGTFIGWYTLPDYTEGQSDEYTGDGYEIEDGSVFAGVGNAVYYAYWTYDYVTVSLMVGSVKYGSAVIKYYSTDYTLPVPENLGAEYDFSGWFASPDGMGTSYSDPAGGSTGIRYDGAEYMYAYVLKTKTFTQTTYDNQTVYAVSAASGAADVTTITVPEHYEYHGIIIRDGAFSSATRLEVLNIPDTVLFVSVTNSGYESGTGAFAGLSKLKEVNVYATGSEPDPTKEVTYYSEDGVLFRKGTTGEAEIIYYPYAKADISYVMPAYVSNEYECEWDYTPVSYPVTAIGTRVFRHAKFTEIILPETITLVAAQAFYDNTNLTRVYFADGGNAGLEIQDDAFHGCTRIEEITLPARYAAFNANAFSDCSSLLNVYMSGENGTYSSEDGVLYGDSGGTLVYFPQAREGDVVVKNGVTVIGEKAFYNNAKITSVNVAESVTEIGVSAFEGCTGIAELTFGGDANSNYLTICERAFYGCTNLTSLTLPKNIYEVDAEAFGGIPRLSYVYLDTNSGRESAELILSAEMFGSENYIRKVVFGVNVPFINNFGAIFDGGYVETFTIEEDEYGNGNQNYSSDDGVVYDATGSVLIYCPHGKSGTYTVLDTCTNIAENAFAGRYNIEEVVIGENVNTIPYGTFFGCISLKKIIVDSENINYGSDNFGMLYAKEYDGVTEEFVMRELIYCPLACVIEGEVVIAETVTKIADSPFYENTQITSVKFETTSTLTFGDMAFYGCTSLETVEFNSDLEGGVISPYTFYGCTSLRYVTLPTNITEIGEYAFYGCVSLVGDLNDSEKGMKLPEGLEIIGDYAFCDSAVEGGVYTVANVATPLAVTIPSTVTKIGDYAFWGCWNDQSAKPAITFASPTSGEEGASLEVGSYAFAYTRYAGGVTIPARTISMGENAFRNSGYYCGTYTIAFEEGCNLTEIGDGTFYHAGENAACFDLKIPSKVQYIGDHAFSYTAVKNVTFGEDSALTELGARAFYGSTLWSIDLPESVTVINYETFWGTLLFSIELPDGVTTIDYGAFQNCYYMEKIEIPASVSYIGKDAFSGCSQLLSVTFAGEGETSQLTEISDGCFSGCTSLYDSAIEPIVLPENLVKIGESAFYGCDKMAEISFPATLEVISASAFEGCSLLSEVTFERYGGGDDGKCSIREIGDRAFYGCTALESFEFPLTKNEIIEVGASVFTESGVTHIDLYTNVSNLGAVLSGLTGITVAFGSDTSYRTSSDGKIVFSLDGKTIVYMADDLSGSYGREDFEGVVTIGDYAFSGQTGITSIELPSSVTSIGAHAFDGCTGLVSFTVDANDTGNPLKIGEYAFYECTNLSKVSMPETVEDIGDYAFFRCDLSETTLPKSIKTIGEETFRLTKLVSVNLPNIETIGDKAFDGYDASTGKTSDPPLKTVVLGESLESVGKYVFEYNTYLETVVLPNRLAVEGDVSFGYWMFYECTNLTTVNLPDNIYELEDRCFYKCSSLKTVVLPSNLVTIDQYAFYQCTALETSVLKEGIQSIGQQAFFQCPLTYVDLPESLTDLGKQCFQASSLKSVTLTSMTELGDRVFYQCTSLENVTIGPQLTSLPKGTFYGCSSLTYIYTGDGVTEIGQDCFGDCDALVKVEFGPNVLTFGNYAFEMSDALESIVLPSSLTSMGNQVFYKCTALKYVFVPSSVLIVGQKIFQECTCNVYIEFEKTQCESYWAGTSWDSGFSGAAYYYSETQPATEGNYWHYVDGVVTEWEIDGYSYTPVSCVVAEIRRDY